MTAEIVHLRRPAVGAPDRPMPTVADLLGRMVDELAEWHDEDHPGRGCWSCASGAGPCPTADLIDETRRARGRLLHPSGMHPAGPRPGQGPSAS